MDLILLARGLKRTISKHSLPVTRELKKKKKEKKKKEEKEKDKAQLKSSFQRYRCVSGRVEIWKCCFLLRRAGTPENTGHLGGRRVLSQLRLMPHSFHDFGTDIQASENLETFFFYQDRKAFLFVKPMNSASFTSCNAHRKVVICLLLTWNILTFFQYYIIN